MFSLKVSNFILRNKNIFERNKLFALLASQFLIKNNPLTLRDIGISTKFNNSYALISEQNSLKYGLIMKRLESYLGAGPFGPKKYWEYPWALANLSLSPNMSVLDAGCGKSPVQYLLADLGMKVTGVDLFEDTEWHGIDRGLAKLFNCKIEYRKESLERLSFTDNIFDRICCLSVLEHCRSSVSENEMLISQTFEDKILQRKIISELVRVLKPGGLLVITLDFNIPRSNCLFESNIDVNNFCNLSEAGMFGNRCPEAFPGESNFDLLSLIRNGDIYIENYLDVLQTSIGLVFKKSV